MVGKRGGKVDTGPAPVVSIGIPAYNATGFLEAAVRSACAQDYPHVRLIVSVDQSTDGTADLVHDLGAVREPPSQLADARQHR